MPSKEVKYVQIVPIVTEFRNLIVGVEAPPDEAVTNTEKDLSWHTGQQQEPRPQVGRPKSQLDGLVTS